MTAADILYGRRGGGWAPGPARTLTPEAQAAADRLRREHAQHPLTVDGLVPGTGMDWPGAARMAAARLEALGPDALDPRDVEALIRADQGNRLLDVPAVVADLDRQVEVARARRAGELRRDDALDRVAAHSDPCWVDQAKDALRRLALDHATLTGDDLWALVPKPPEPRAAGPLWKWAQRAGLIEPTGEFVPTTQATSHASPSRVWRSLIHEAR